MKLSSRKQLLSEADAELKRMKGINEAEDAKLDLKINQLETELGSLNAQRGNLPDSLLRLLEGIISAFEQVENKYNELKELGAKLPELEKDVKAVTKDVNKAEPAKPGKASTAAADMTTNKPKSKFSSRQQYFELPTGQRITSP